MSTKKGQVMSEGPMLRKKRRPTSQERAAATVLARKVHKVIYPGRDKDRVMSYDPPGRLIIRDYIDNRMAKKTSGSLHDVMPIWEDRRKTKTIHTKIKVGIMCDISGSMSRAMEPLAVTQWMLSNALHQAHAEVAVVLFGEYAHGVLQPGEVERQVNIYEATGSFENFISGFSMIDARLDLIDDTDAARMLVVMTDGHFVGRGHVSYTEKIMSRCRKSGVAVLWVSFDRYFARTDRYGWGELINATSKDPSGVALTIGDAIIEQFRRVAPQHMWANTKK